MKVSCKTYFINTYYTCMLAFIEKLSPYSPFPDPRFSNSLRPSFTKPSFPENPPPESSQQSGPHRCSHFSRYQSQGSASPGAASGSRCGVGGSQGARARPWTRGR